MKVSSNQTNFLKVTSVRCALSDVWVCTSVAQVCVNVLDSKKLERWYNRKNNGS